MRQLPYSLSRLDFFGFTTSFLCALHCMAMPLLLSFSGLGSLHFLDNPWFEGSILLISLLLALSSLFPSWYHRHKKSKAIGLMVMGFALIGLSHIFLAGLWEAFATSAGATLLATAHYVNWKLLKKHHQS